MTVSVVMSTYNRTKLLMERSLLSVLRQTVEPDEIIIVGDGTEQATADALAALGDSRIRFTNLPRMTYPEDPGSKWCVLGLEARNYGLDQVTSDWVTTLDDDDEYTIDHIAVLLAAVKQSGNDFVYGKSIAHWPDGHDSVYGNWPPGHFQFCDGAGLWRASLPQRYEMDCLKRGLPEDGDLWDRMVADGVTFTFIPEVVHHYFPNPR